MIRKLFTLLLFLTSPGLAHAENWYEASSAHFTVYSTDRPERLRKYAGDLERFDQAMRALRQIPDEPVDKANRLTVYMLDSASAVGKLIGDSWVAGFYEARAGGSVAFAPRSVGDGSEDSLDSQTVLFHEYAHHFMTGSYVHSAFPTWIVEGWAEFHATARLNRDGSVLFGASPNYRAWGLLTGNPLPLDRIVSDDTARLKEDQREALYGRGWLLVHYLTFEPSRAGQMRRYVADINLGKTPAQAAAVFGDLKQLNGELERYLNRPRLSAVNITADKLHIGEIAVRQLSPGEAATMDVRIRSKRGVDEKTAPAVYAAAQKAAAPFPNDPGAQVALAEAAFDAGDYAASEAAADRAIAADANAIDGYVYKAKSKMAVASAAHDFSPSTWSAIRRIIAAGNHIDPDDPEPLILYFHSYIDAHVAPNTNAKDGLYRAFELCPQDRGLRMLTAQLYRNDGQPEMARALLRLIAYDPHSGAMAAVASKMIADIDSRTPPPLALPAPAGTPRPAANKPKEAPVPPHAP
jgi:tetratricopeptide (TPR) repeat protein